MKGSPITPAKEVPFDDTRSAIRPPLKWAGGKRWQLPFLKPLWDKHSSRRLVEPFCGGLAVTLGLLPERALLNDINPHLISFYEWLKKRLIISLALKNNSEHYYRYRNRFNRLLKAGESDSAEAASLFYYLNRTGYNGLCRFNRSGEFNVPFGRYASIGYKYDFSEYKHVFSAWEFRNVYFDKVPLEPTDFVYADPPYDVQFTQYSKDGFGWEEQERTARWLAEHPGPVVLSNQATERILELYGDLGYRLKKLDAPRRISCTGDRTPAPEVIAIRNIVE
ncbi:MAG: DNA adenine methylase [Gammaproteobacteria bacterium]